jgi:predicted alpha/beta-fold hydrolase
MPADPNRMVKSIERVSSEYVPVARWAGGHKMTVYAWARPRRFPDLPDPVERHFNVADESCVMARCHWHEDPPSHPTLILLHGLEGSSDAHYMCGIAAKAWARGYNILRLNQRNCGGTEHLSRGLYHSGLTADPLYVLRELIERDRLQRISFAGYSLGGNVALKLAGELGDAAPAELKAVCAVSPVLELEACVRAIERRQNIVYELNFVRNLKGRMRRKAAAFPQDWDLTRLRRIWSIRAFDEHYTAPHHGFAGATDYYHRASAMRVIDRVRIPALIITAADDPFVPPEPFYDEKIRNNPQITTLVTAHGGHCGFVAEANGYDGYWAEQKIVDFVDQLIAKQ